MMGKEAWVAGADRREAPGPKPVRLGHRLRLRRQPPGSWQLCNGGVQRGVSKDPVQFQKQVEAVCDTYLEAPALEQNHRTHTVSSDEMTGLQALERNAPVGR